MMPFGLTYIDKSAEYQEGKFHGVRFWKDVCNWNWGENQLQQDARLDVEKTWNRRKSTEGKRAILIRSILRLSKG